MTRTRVFASIALCSVAAACGRGDGPHAAASAQRSLAPTSTSATTAAHPHAAGGAASFACARAATLSERTICGDPVPRAQDRAMSSAWAQALSASPDIDALRKDQHAWLAQRHECGADARCMRARYAMRLPELAAVGGGFAWSGRWQRVEWVGLGATLTLRTGPRGAVHVEIGATNGANTGGFGGDGVAAGDRLVAHYGHHCTVTLQRVDTQIDLAQQGACDAGAGVDFAGRYVHDGAPLPDWNLLTLGVISEPAVDTRLQTLLGDDGYAQLVATANEVNIDTGTPGLVELGVQGLSTIREAALLHAMDDHLYVALLDGDVLRYYTDDPKAVALPPALAAWRSRFPKATVQRVATVHSPAGATAR